MSKPRSTEPLSPEAFASANAVYWQAYHACSASTHEGAHEVALRAALRDYLDREVARQETTGEVA